MNLSNTPTSKGLRLKSTPDVGSMVFGKVQPQATELEEAILGALMLEKGAFDTVVEILNEKMFYMDSHQRIFGAMKRLADKSKPIDLLTVVEELKFTAELEQVGGAFAVSKLTNNVISSANVEAHARIVLQKFLQRELIRISGETIRDAYEDTIDIFDMLDFAESRLFEITNSHLRRNFDKISSVLVKTMNRINDMRARDEDITGVPSGFPKLDRITYGWQNTDLIILAARPSVGKTAFALNLARNAALNTSKPTPVGFFSLEMSSGQLVQRILSAESEIHMEKISRGRLEGYEMQQLVTKGADRLSTAPIFIDDTGALNIFELRAKCRRLKNKHNIGLIIIDYLQLMSGTGDRNSNREQEISKISRDLKSLAKELEIPIIALSQLSREVEKRKDSGKIPQLSDLRESGAIEQDADMVMFLYRPDYHEIINDAHGNDVRGDVYVKIAKHRNGALDTIKLKARLEIQKFVENEDEDEGLSMGNVPPRTGKFIPVKDADDDMARMYVQKQSRMNDDAYKDEDDNEENDDAHPFN